MVHTELVMRERNYFRRCPDTFRRRKACCVDQGVGNCRSCTRGGKPTVIVCVLRHSWTTSVSDRLFTLHTCGVGIDLFSDCTQLRTQASTIYQIIPRLRSQIHDLNSANSNASHGIPPTSTFSVTRSALTTKTGSQTLILRKKHKNCHGHLEPVYVSTLFTQNLNL